MIVKNFTYVFLNKPDTTTLEWIRFTDPYSPKRGLIKNVTAVHGPIAALGFTDNSIRIYYTGLSDDVENFKGKRVVREIKLANAGEEATDPSTWIKPVTDQTAKKSELNFEANIIDGSRLLNDLSFLSASSRPGKDGILYPVITFRNAGANFYTYAWKDPEKSAWNTTQLQLDS